MVHNKKSVSPNTFIALLVMTALFFLLGIFILNISSRQSYKSRASNSQGCNGNIDCPSGTACRGGLCVIVKPSITQTPLSYVDISTIQETPRPIPNVYSSPTPTPKVNILVYMSSQINGTIGGIIRFIGNIFENIVQDVSGIWSTD